MTWRRWLRKMITSSVFDMRIILHVRTQPDDTLADRVIATQRKQADVQVKVVDLTAPEPDYGKLLEEIFAADSVAVW